MPYPTHSEKSEPAATRASNAGWWQAARTAAHAALAEHPFPAGREEAWRFTDVSLLRDERFEAELPARTRAQSHEAEVAWRRLREGASGWALVQNGHVGQVGLADPALGHGVQLLSLGEALERIPDLLRAHLGALVGAEDAFTARNLAHVEEGLVLHVPAGVTVPDPVRVLHWVDAAGAQIETRLLVVLGPGARARLEVVREGPALAAPTRAQDVAEVFLGAGAVLQAASVQQLGRGAHLLEHVRFALESGAQLQSLVGSFGASFARYRLGVRLEGPGAEATLAGGYFPGQGQHHEFWTQQDHRAPATRSDLLYKGALGGDAESVYYGAIRVRPGARATDAYQNNRNLLLSSAAHAYTNPQLEIETDEVRCTHGAAVARIDDEPLFYLMSRGLSAAAAERLVLTGYFGELLARGGVDEGSTLGQWLATAVDRALAREAADSRSAQSPEGARDVGDRS